MNRLNECLGLSMLFLGGIKLPIFIRTAVALMLLALGMHARPGLGCASCGSGGANPLILYPNEYWKTYFGVSQQYGLTNIDSAGGEVQTFGPSRKSILTVSLGALLSRRSFATITIPYITNYHADGGQQRSGFGDPSLAGRLTLLEQSFARPWIPQIQAIASFKPTVTTSMLDFESPYQTDVFGSGYNEYRVGLDFWQGMNRFKAGLAHVFTYSQERTVDADTYQPGLSQRTTLVAGVGFDPWGKVLMGTNILQSAPRRFNGDVVGGSQARDFGLFVTGDYNVSSTSQLRLTWARSAAYGPNRQTARSDTVTAAYMKSFL